MDLESNTGATSTEIIGVPIGTLDEVLAQGLSPELVACCHAPSPDGSIRGCPVWRSCQFGRRDMGAFKGEGPHYIGYYLKTARADKAHQVESVMSCYNFTRVLQGRMAFGRAQRDAGKDHELIRIVAQEPKPGSPCEDECRCQAGNHRVRVQIWERNAADGGNRSGDITMKSRREWVTVPRFPRPAENPEITYAQELMAREDRRLASEEGDEIARFARMRDDFVAEGETGDDESTDVELGSVDESASEATPLATPASRKEKA